MKKQLVKIIVLLVLMGSPLRAQTIQEVTAEKIARAVSDTLYWDALNEAGIDKDDDIADAIRRYKETGQADVVKKSNVVYYPYGASQPVVKCGIRRACLIHLEKGEIPYDVVLGDETRWTEAKVATGPMRDTPLLVVKPNEPRITTNLIITTNKRIYHLFLRSDNARRTKNGSSLAYPDPEYYREVGFYYPETVVSNWEEAVAQKQELFENVLQEQRRIKSEEAAAIAAEIASRDTTFNILYDDGFPVFIKNIFASEGRTYIELSESAEYKVLPAIFARDVHGKREIVNYHIDGRYYVIDRVAKTLELVIGQGLKRNWYGKKRTAEVRAQIVNRG